MITRFLFLLFGLAIFIPSPFGNAETVKIRAAHFPNVTHAPALIAHATGKFEKAFEERAEIEWKIFNAGPEAIEALFASAIDILYVGPNPAVNGFVKSKGEALVILAGVASGGSAFVVHPESGIEKFEDVRGKRVAAPQIGNTQDVALRYLMKTKGLKSKSEGGDVEIFHLSGGDQITAFAKKQVNAIWTVEPWVSRLVAETGARIFFDEAELWPEGIYPTTVLVARKKFADQHPDLINQWLQVHTDLVDWMNSNLGEAKSIFNEELKNETGKALPLEYLDASFKKITFTTDPMQSQIFQSASRAAQLGFLKTPDPDLSGLYGFRFLEASAETSEGP